MKRTFFMFALMLCSSVLYGGASRVRFASEAKQLCDQNTNSVIAVFLHGTDWCPSGETILSNVWNTQKFESLLPDSVILTTWDWIDRPLNTFRDRVRDSVHRSIAVKMNASLPIAEMGTKFTVLKDGEWLIDRSGPDPDKEVLTQILRFSMPVSMLRLTVMTQPGRDKIGPGNAPDGNLVISEIEVMINGEKQIISILASDFVPGRNGLTACDGIINGNNGWGAGIEHKNNELYLFPVDGPFPADTDILMKIRYVHNAKKFTLGHYRLDAYTFYPWMPPKAVLLESICKRSMFYHPVSNRYPTLNCFDADGKLLGTGQSLPYSITAEKMASKIKQIISRRDRWKLLLKMASKEPSLINKTKMMSDACVLIREAGFPGVRNLQKEILKVDPKRTSPWTWRVLPDMQKINQGCVEAAKSGNKQNEIDFIDKMANSPLLAETDPVFRQNLIFRKFNIYRGWTGHTDGRFDTLCEIIKIDWIRAAPVLGF